MSSDWPLIPIGKCLEKVVDNRGKTPPLSEIETPHGLIEVNAIVGSNKHPDYAVVRKYVASSTYQTWFRAGHPRVGDVLFSTVGSIAEVAIYEGGNGCIAQNLVGLRPKSSVIDADYLYYVLVNPVTRSKLKTLDISSVQPSIKVPHLLATEITVPDLSQQRMVTSVLTALDDRITLLRETNATLEAIAQALFKSWFVDFDPVRAKQQGRAPEGMSDATAALFPDSFEESAVGLVPRGWRAGVLGDIAKTEKNQLQPSSLHSELHYVGLEHIPRKSLSLSEWGNAEGLESAKATFNKGDILFGKLRPYFHKVVIAPFDGVCSTDILVCQSKIPAYYGLTVMQLFSKTLIDYAERLSNGAKMPRVNWKDLADYPICIPPGAWAENYNEIIKPIISRMAENVHMAQTLATLRNTLLPRLISGQLRLPEADAKIMETI